MPIFAMLICNTFVYYYHFYVINLCIITIYYVMNLCIIIIFIYYVLLIKVVC